MLQSIIENLVSFSERSGVSFILNILMNGIITVAFISAILLVIFSIGQEINTNRRKRRIKHF